jgi:hypothetical protein
MASRVTISEFANLGFAGDTAQIATLPSLRDQAVLDITSGVQSSAACGADTKYVRIVAEVRASVRVGGTATIANMVLMANTPEYFGVQPGAVISVIANP